MPSDKDNDNDSGDDDDDEEDEDDDDDNDDAWAQPGHRPGLQISADHSTTCNK